VPPATGGFAAPSSAPYPGVMPVVGPASRLYYNKGMDSAGSGAHPGWYRVGCWWAASPARVARHIAWRCDCGVVTYGAPLVDDAAC